jgi:quercetin dioxygenase-like cupin family protein
LAYGIAETLPATPADLALFRFGIEPGVTFPFDPNDPSVALAYVESGSATFSIDAPASVLRAASEATSFPEATEEFAAGEEFTLEEGDSVIVPPNVSGEVRNDGDEPLTLLVANIAPLEEAMPEGEMAEGTPTS